MESKNETSSVILKLMGIDKAPSQDHPVRNRPKVLSEDYLQKVASIGLRKKHLSHQRRSFGNSTDEKEGSNNVLIVVETLMNNHHNSSKGNGKENLSGFCTKTECVPQKTSVKTDQGNSPQLQQQTNNGSQVVVHGEDGLYETFRFSKENPGKEGNGEIKMNIRRKVGFGYRFARKVPITKPHGAASVIVDNCGTMTKDDLFQKYWGLSKKVSANRSTEKSENQVINLKNCSEDMNLKSSSEKSPSFSLYFNSNDTENCTDLHKLKKRCYENDLFETEPTLSQLSSSDPSHAFVDSHILQQNCLINEDVKNNEDSNMSKQISMSLDSSVDLLVFDAQTKVVGCSDNSPTTQQSESMESVMTNEDSDLLGYASKQQEKSEFQEDSLFLLCIGADTDALGDFHKSYGPSPVSVLDSTFSEDISVISEYGVAGEYDSSEMDDDGLDLNVSSDEDCGNKSVEDYEKKKDIAGLSRPEESRDFSYVVEVLTEAGLSNTGLFKDFSSWHSTDCPISPSVFETLEKKFGEQQLWKRSERRLLFDRINLGLLDILHPSLFVPMWEKSASRRMNVEPSQYMIEDDMWGLLVSQEKKAGKESVDNMLGGEITWIDLGEDVEDIVREIVKLLIDELIDNIVS